MQGMCFRCSELRNRLMPSKKDNRKRKNSSDIKPWKTSKGYGTASGRECYPGRNYGSKRETRPKWPVTEDGETEAEIGVESEMECELDERQAGPLGKVSSCRKQDNVSKQSQRL